MRPQWTKRFVREEHPKLVNGNANSILHFKTSWPLVSLLGCSVTGLVSTALSAFFPHQSLVNLLLAASWVCRLELLQWLWPKANIVGHWDCSRCLETTPEILSFSAPLLRMHIHCQFDHTRGQAGAVKTLERISSSWCRYSISCCLYLIYCAYARPLYAT